MHPVAIRTMHLLHPYLPYDKALVAGGSLRSRSSMQARSMASFGPTASPNSEHPHHLNKGTLIFSYTCAGLTGTAILLVVVFFCYHIRNRAAPVAAAGAETGAGGRGGSVDLAKLPAEFAYTRSARHSGSGVDGAQCSVCLGAVQPGEMVRTLPLCKHLYHVECIDMWLASHDTCPLCRAEVELPV